MAPEVLTGVYHEKCDIWSLGVIMYILICGYPPFSGKNEQIVLTRVVLGKVSFDSQEWKEIPSEVKNLILHMIDINVKTRFTPAQVIKDKFIAEAGTEKSSKSDLSHSFRNLETFRVEISLRKDRVSASISNLDDDNYFIQHQRRRIPSQKPIP